MDGSIAMAEGIFGRCPSCLKNMIQGICSFSCSPYHWKFVNILKTETNPISLREYVTSIEVRIAESYINETYDSCKGVIHPSSGRRAMDIACGAYDSRTCTPERWHYYMGEPSINPLVPFQIVYTLSDNPNDRFDTNTTKACNESYDVRIP